MTDPLLLEIPEELRTERLVLRAPRFGDGEVTYASVRESLEELKVWMTWASDAYSPVDAERWCRRNAAAFFTRDALAFLLFEGANHVGNMTLFAFDWKVPKCEIGYWLRTSRCGKGLMTEAVRAGAALAFDVLSMQRIEIRTDDRNARSSGVAERCGFQLDGLMRSECRVDGTLRDTRVYSRIAGLGSSKSPSS